MSVSDNNIKMAKIVAPALVVAFLGMFIILAVWTTAAQDLGTEREIGRIEACASHPEPTECLSVDR